MSSFVHQRQPLQLLHNEVFFSAHAGSNSRRSTSFLSRTILLLIVLLVVLGLLFSCMDVQEALYLGGGSSLLKWKEYTLEQAVRSVAKNNTVVVCVVSHPYLPLLSNWLISVARQKQQERVLVISEDYETLYKVNQRWPGHAVLIPPAIDSQTAHKFGSQGFFNFTSRRPQHLLKILELGYNVLYNDVDMVWLGDPFPYFSGNHDVYFADDMRTVKPLDHGHGLPPPGKKGSTYICSCFLFLRSTEGAKLLMHTWIQELGARPWSKSHRSNDQPAFNWALNITAPQVEVYLLPQTGFPSGGLYFKNKTWVDETKEMHVVVHNNYIIGFDKKVKRFREFGLWYADLHHAQSPLDNL